MKWAQQEEAEVVRIKDKAYNSDFAAATEMLRGSFPGLNKGLPGPLGIDNWNNLDRNQGAVLGFGQGENYYYREVSK